MNPKKAFRKFGNALMAAGPNAGLLVGLSWVGDGKGWRVVMSVTDSGVPRHALMLSPQDARTLAKTYDKHHQEPEWRGKTTGVEWVAPELRSLADEAEQKTRDKIIPEGAAEHMPTQGMA